ncbi:MAG: hypothetical protein OIF58_13560 [Cohaesibacter sp.]|nr:hypothetical protein [Cohaesibacter sp.]
MDSLFNIRNLCVVAVLFPIAACQTTGDKKVALTAAQVRATFVDRDWGFRPTDSHFAFKSNGKYQYHDSKFKVFGTYKIAPNGVLCATNAKTSKAAGRKTCYTFYTQGDTYVYYHDRSKKFHSVYLR